MDPSSKFSDMSIQHVVTIETRKYEVTMRRAGRTISGYRYQVGNRKNGEVFNCLCERVLNTEGGKNNTKDFW